MGSNNQYASVSRKLDNSYSNISVSIEVKKFIFRLFSGSIPILFFLGSFWMSKYLQSNLILIMMDKYVLGAKTCLIFIKYSKILLF